MLREGAEAISIDKSFQTVKTATGNARSQCSQPASKNMQLNIDLSAPRQLPTGASYRGKKMTVRDMHDKLVN